MTARLTSQVVAVFGPPDRTLTDLLIALGARVMSLPAEQIGSFSAAAKPDLAIIDVREANQLPDATGLFRRRFPDAPMILLCAALDPALILEAMRSGISECVTDPISEDVLTAAIGRVASQLQRDATGATYAFIGAKGGIGTTTLAVNAASSLAKTQARVLYIDLHMSGGDAAVFLGAEPRFAVTDALDNIHRLDEAFFKTLIVPTAAKVDLLASSSHYMAWTTDAKRIRQLLDFAHRQYRFVILDCPRSDATVIDALEAVNRIVLVTNQELATLRSGSRMAAMLRQRYGSDRVMVVANRFDATNEISHQDIERVLGTSIKHAVPSDYRASLDALNQGTPLTMRNHTRLVGAIDALARDLAGLPAPAPVAVKGTGFLGLLTGKR